MHSLQLDALCGGDWPYYTCPTDVKARDVTKPVGKHFCLPGHNDFSQLKVHILEFCQTPPDKAHKKHREQVERKWQERLRSSYPWGLNWEDAIPFI